MKISVSLYLDIVTMAY